MKKTFELGKIAYTAKQKRNMVDVEVELRDTPEGPVFTASGGIWNSPHTDYVSCGQMLDTIDDYFPDDPLFQKIYRLWKLYHLNDMNAGTLEQTACIEAYKKENPDWRYAYDKACQVLKEHGLYEVMLNGEPYRYGHKWLYRAIPEDDLQEIRSLFS